MDAVAGSPLLTFGDVILDDLSEAEREAVLSCKLAAVLWLKSVVEVFAAAPDVRLRYQVAAAGAAEGSCASGSRC